MLVVLFGVLAAWSFGKWIDPQIDFGNQLYIPWQLTEGQALYRDIAYRNGPLSQHTNALWFALFGVSVRTLVLCNLAVLAVLAGGGSPLDSPLQSRWMRTSWVYHRTLGVPTVPQGVQ